MPRGVICVFNQRGSTVNVLDKEGNRVVFYWYELFSSAGSFIGASYTADISFNPCISQPYDERNNSLIGRTKIVEAHALLTFFSSRHENINPLKGRIETTVSPKK